MAVEVVQDVRIVVRITGEIDLANVDEFNSALSHAVGQSPDGFVVDASGVSYIDGTGIRSILGAWQRVRNTGGIAIVAGGVVRRLAEALDLEELPCLLFCDTMESAMDALSRCAVTNEH